MKNIIFLISLLLALVLLSPVIYHRFTRRNAKPTVKLYANGGELALWVCKGKLDDHGSRGIYFIDCWWQPVGGYLLSSSKTERQWSNVPWKSETPGFLYVWRAGFVPPADEPEGRRSVEVLGFPLAIMSYHDTMKVVWTRHYDYNQQGVLLATRDDFMAFTAYSEEK